MGSEPETGRVAESMTGYELASRLLDHPKGGVEVLIRFAESTETDWLEFKAGMYARPEDQREGEKRPDTYWHVAKAVIALANTRGGAVVVGVEDKNHTAVGLRHCDPNKVIDKDGLEGYRRREILERIDPSGGKWATGCDGTWELDGRLPDGQVEIRGEQYQNEDIAVILVRPVEGECIGVWKGQIEQVLCRRLGDVGKVEPIIGSKRIVAYEQSRRPGGADLAAVWRRFEEELLPATAPPPAGLDDAIAGYHRSLRGNAAFKEAICTWTDLSADEQEPLTDEDEETVEPIAALDDFDRDAVELLPYEFDDDVSEEDEDEDDRAAENIDDQREDASGADDEEPDEDWQARL